jgi:MFS family permease
MRIMFSHWLAHTFRALHSRNYRWYFVGQGLSLIGTWMQRVAMSWLVYRLTGSALALGVADFAAQFSAFLLMPVAGVLLDRYCIRRSLLVTQVMGLIQAVFMVLLVASGSETLGNVLVLSVMLGCVNSVDMPGRQAFAVHLVEHKEDLGNAIALNSTIFNLARLLGPSIAGVTIAWAGEGVCFLLNALSFFPILFVLWHIHPVENQARPPRQPLWQGIREGLAYSWNRRSIRYILLELTLVSLIGMPYMVLLPIIADQVLAGGPDTMGFLMGASGVGALAGALFMADRQQMAGTQKLIPVSFGWLGVGVILLSMGTTLRLCLPLMVFIGFWMVVGWSASNTSLQAMVDDSKRGRVMSLYVMTFTGAAPIGSLGAGALATHLGAPAALFWFGIACLAGTAMLWPALWHIPSDELHP